MNPNDNAPLYPAPDDRNSSSASPVSSSSQRGSGYPDSVAGVPRGPWREGASDEELREDLADAAREARRSRRLRLLGRVVAVALPVLIVLGVGGFVAGRLWLRTALKESLPVLDGAVSVKGLSASVTVLRDEHGVPHLKAGSMDDLVFAQGYVTAGDRLWQMDGLRRHAAGELAEILGPSMVAHDRDQRYLQLRAAADRALTVLPVDQRHWLDVYAAGVNAQIAAMEGSGGHLPLEFRLLRYKPAPWSARDSLLVGLAMFQDLSTSFPEKLDREALQAKLAPELAADLYPVGSWRDHWPEQPVVDLTVPGKQIEEIPLDESQTRLVEPQSCPLSVISCPLKTMRGKGDAAVRFEATGVQPETAEVGRGTLTTDNSQLTTLSHLQELAEAKETLALLRSLGLCEGCLAGSNGWAVAGSRTKSGKPMLSSDMHLRHGVPGIWYEADLEAAQAGGLGTFHVGGVTLPGTPFVIVGHNEHIAWGFTNLFADVQDLYVEQTRGSGATTLFEDASGAWHPVGHHLERIRVSGGRDVTLDVMTTRHGGVETPLIAGGAAAPGTGIYPKERRALSLRWTIYDPANLTSPFYAVNAASDWQSLLAAMASFGGPTQNMMYADDQGHIGYHAVGRIPVRGATPAGSLAEAQAMVLQAQPAAVAQAADTASGVPAELKGVVPAAKAVWTPLSGVPVSGRDVAQEWAGYIPFDQMPQAFDPTGGVLATANARITPENYPYPVSLDWSDPYRNERIWKVLESKHGLVPADMLTLQTDVYSEVDRVIAERLTYAIDHSAVAGYAADGQANAQTKAGHLSKEARWLRQAADLMRSWDGTVAADKAAPAIVDAARAALWPMILKPQLGAQADALWPMYVWGEKAYAQEQIVVHQPAHWLPATYANWNELLAGAVEQGLIDEHAPQDLGRWRFGETHPLEITHPVYGRSQLLATLLGMKTGTGVLPQSGDGSTVKQVGRTFGPSERLTVDFGNLDGSTLNVVLGESMNPASPWYRDQFKAWYGGTTFAMPFSDGAMDAAAKHKLILEP
jgi:penicillin amidase